MNMLQRISRDGTKKYFYIDYGRGSGKRAATGIFVYTKPTNHVQKNHNKEALMLLETKKSQQIIEQQAIGSAYIPQHKFKANFLEYFTEYVQLNARKGNRHLRNSLEQFKLFIKKDFISPVDITENFCKRFRQFLLDKYTGETPGNYYSCFKWVVNAAESDRSFQKNPTAKVASKSNPSKRLKENLEADEYLNLLTAPCLNEDVRAAFIFSCYTGLRWVDVKKMEWKDLRDEVLTTRIIQAKTGQPVMLTLHPIAKAMLENQKRKLTSFNPAQRVFTLPGQDGANKVLMKWVKDARIEKYITWSCARLSFSILLQDKNVDDATVAYLLGHTTTEQVRKTYKRHRPKNQITSISHLPIPDSMPRCI
jgi:integrase